MECFAISTLYSKKKPLTKNQPFVQTTSLKNWDVVRKNKLWKEGENSLLLTLYMPPLKSGLRIAPPLFRPKKMADSPILNFREGTLTAFITVFTAKKAPTFFLTARIFMDLRQSMGKICLSCLGHIFFSNQTYHHDKNTWNPSVCDLSNRILQIVEKMIESK